MATLANWPTTSARLQQILPNLKVLGGCCGTDHRHISAIGQVCVHARAA